MKVVKIRTVYDAEEYRPGLEDGFDKIAGYEEYLGWRGDSLIVKVPYISMVDGKQYISRGDIIRINSDGSKKIIKPDDFKRDYEKVED